MREVANQQQGLYRPEFEHDNCGIGAVVNIKGKKTHDTVANALKIVENLEHRAGKDAEGKTGDGVGILLQISHKFFKKVCKKEGFEIGGEREYGVAQLFFPQHEIKRAQAKKMFEIIVAKEGMEFLGRARQVVLQMDNLERRYGGNQPEGMRFAVSSHHFTFVERAFLDVAQQVGSGRFDLVLNETQTQQIIDDVARCDSDLGVMYLSRANEGAVGRVLDRNKLEFYELFEAVPHVFLRFGHPLAGRESVSLDDLYPYPQLSFVQGAYESSAFSEEPLWAPSAKTVKVSDRGFATSFMLHSDAYTVTSGVYPEFLQRGAITAVPIRSGERMHIGYVMPRGLTLDAIGEAFVAAMKLYAKVEG